MPDGSKWDVPADIIAENRAKYYEEKEGSDAYCEEFKIAMEEKEGLEIIDWAAGNMNWDDVKHLAMRVEDAAECDFQEGWVNGEKEITERDTGEV